LACTVAAGISGSSWCWLLWLLLLSAQQPAFADQRLRRYSCFGFGFGRYHEGVVVSEKGGSYNVNVDLYSRPSSSAAYLCLHGLPLPARSTSTPTHDPISAALPLPSAYNSTMTRNIGQGKNIYIGLDEIFTKLLREVGVSYQALGFWVSYKASRGRDGLPRKGGHC